MTAIASVYGRLGADPEAVATKTGKLMPRASLAVDPGEGRPTLWVKLIAFGERAEHLAAHAKGDTLSAVGRLQLSEWQDREGATRQTLEVVIDTLISARRTPARKAERQATAPRPGSPTGGVPLDDELAF